MSLGKKWDTVATHTQSHQMSALGKRENYHSLQKDKSPDAGAPSKQERDENTEEWKMERNAVAEHKTKEGQQSTDPTVLFKKVSTADSWICAEITNCRGKASTHLNRACRRP